MISEPIKIVIELPDAIIEALREALDLPPDTEEDVPEADKSAASTVA